MTSHLTQQQEYTLIVGLGKTGISVVRYLSSLGDRVVVADSRKMPPALKALIIDFPDIEYHTGPFDQKLFLAANRIVISPGVPLLETAVQTAKNEGIELISDLDLFARVVSAPVIGITGSNGKSTVTALLGEMAEQAKLTVAIGGNYGTPVLDLIDNSIQLYVLELSSFQLETLHDLPMAASVVLNISPDHLDRYDDVFTYAMCKQTIYDAAQQVVINLDDELASLNIVNSNEKNATAFTLGVPHSGQFGVIEDERKGARWLSFGNEKLLAVERLKIKGDHNIQNALAALALGHCVEIPMQTMLDALVKFDGLAHRTQWVAVSDGVNWFNDSKATNVGATIAAVRGLPGKHILIAGGDSKGADFSALSDVAGEHLLKVVLLGKDAKKIEIALSGKVACEYAVDMRDAVSIAARSAKPGDNVLLSPACASWDMFSSFEQRGDVFTQAVKELLK